MFNLRCQAPSTDSTASERDAVTSVLRYCRLLAPICRACTLNAGVHAGWRHNASRARRTPELTLASRRTPGVHARFTPPHATSWRPSACIGVLWRTWACTPTLLPMYTKMSGWCFKARGIVSKEHHRTHFNDRVFSTMTLLT